MPPCTTLKQWADAPEAKSCLSISATRRPRSAASRAAAAPAAPPPIMRRSYSVLASSARFRCIVGFPPFAAATYPSSKECTRVSVPQNESAGRLGRRPALYAGKCCKSSALFELFRRELVPAEQFVEVGAVALGEACRLT